MDKEDEVPKDSEEAKTVAEVKKNTRRRGIKRSRGACITCKFRKVKCDEAKPVCNRCLTYGVICDGYSEARKKSRPQGQASFTQGSKLLPAPPSDLKFADEIERKHFANFKNETAVELAGAFDLVFWEHIVLQACHQEPFVLKTVIALSALTTSQKLQADAGLDPTNRAIAARTSEYAYQQYHGALKRMRDSLSHEKSPRKALIACLLVCCFEGSSGNSKTVLVHATSGQQMLEEWLDQHPYRQSHKAGLVSPAPHIIEDELIQAARYFDLQLGTFFDTRSLEDHEALQHEGDISIREMPEQFRSIEEARLYCFLLGRRVTHFTRCAIPPLNADFSRPCPLVRTPIYELKSAKAPCILPANFEKVAVKCPDHLSQLDPDPCTIGMAARAGIGLGKGLDVKNPSFCVRVTPEILDRAANEQRRHANDLDRWLSAFRILYSKIEQSSFRMSNAGHTLCIIIHTMKLLSLSVLQSRSAYWYSNDENLLTFREIVATARKIVRTKDESARIKFSFGIALIPTLHFTAMCCRDRAVRREALEVMRRYGTRESSWNCQYYLALDTRMMELEEEGVETEEIPETARVRVIDTLANDEERWARISYIRGQPTAGEPPRETLIRW